MELASAINAKKGSDLLKGEVKSTRREELTNYYIYMVIAGGWHSK